MISFTEDELGDKVPKTERCEKCNADFPVKNSISKDGTVGTLQYFTCDCGTFLVGLKGRKLPQ